MRVCVRISRGLFHVPFRLWEQFSQRATTTAAEFSFQRGGRWGSVLIGVRQSLNTEGHRRHQGTGSAGGTADTQRRGLLQGSRRRQKRTIDARGDRAVSEEEGIEA